MNENKIHQLPLCIGMYIKQSYICIFFKVIIFKFVFSDIYIDFSVTTFGKTSENLGDLFPTNLLPYITACIVNTFEFLQYCFLGISP